MRFPPLSAMLKSLFLWLDQHPGSYWIPVGAASLLLVARVGHSLGRESRQTAGPALHVSWRDGVVLFLFLLAWRWPFLLVAYDYNPDESQMIAGALTLARDPVFWRSVDGGSSGPLNYYLLVPWHWLGVPLDYFTARLTCILLTWAALFACLRALAGQFGRTAAWLGVLPGAAFFATVGHPELTNLSTEHLPLALAAVSFALLADRSPADRARLWTAAFLAGALPWSKLQAAPLGVVLVGWAGWQVFRAEGVPARIRWRRVAEVLAASALPGLLVAGLAVVTGQGEAAWRRYFLQNVHYAGTGSAPTVGEAMGRMWDHAQADGRFPLLFGTVAAGLLAATAYLAWRRIRPPALMVAAGLLTLAAVAAVSVPRRDYLHYALFLTIPLVLWLGAAVGTWWREVTTTPARIALGGALLVAGLLPLGTRWQSAAPVYGGFTHHWRYPRSCTGAVLRALATRGDTLGVWGWACFLYVETGLPQATRDGNTLWSIQENIQQGYHRAAYLADLKRNAPALFVDAVGQGAFVFSNRTREGHEVFPELNAYIHEHYTLVVDLQETRIYARRGLPALGQLGEDRLKEVIAQGRNPETATLSLPGSSLGPHNQRLIDGRRVLMLLPPAQMEWELDAEVRAVSFEYGYDPVAYEHGHSNGTDILLEVVGPDSTVPIFQRFLNPARQPGDRGLQRARETLPPFVPGSRLVLQTDPGPSGDTAWDWVYLARLQLHRESDTDPE